MLLSRRVAFLCLLFCVLSLYAQEDTEEPPIQSDWSRYVPSIYSRGDQIFGITLGVGFPLFYVDKENGFTDTQMNLGGLGALSYNYYLSSRLFWGIELCGAFFSTVAQTNYFIVPMGAKIGYQFVYNRFEFPFSLLIGAAPQQYRSTTYFGLFVKPTASTFFRFNPEWSLGLNLNLWWVPQWTEKERSSYAGTVNIHGFFFETSLTVRYHF
jgi:hypothetical protein